MKSKIVYSDAKLQQTLEAMQYSKAEDKKLYKWINRALDDLEKNAFCGIQVQKKIIPKTYRDKYDIDNLWKYDLPEGWRLIYSITNRKICVLTIILEWLNHKDYERRFKY